MPLSQEELDAILAALGSEDQAMNAVDVARGTLPGNVAPELEGRSPEDLALLDRTAWGQQARKHYGPAAATLSTLPVAAYEGLKGVSEVPFGPGRGLMDLAGKILSPVAGAQGAEQAMATDSTTSPASLQNVLAYLRGAFRGRKPVPYEDSAKALLGRP